MINAQELCALAQTLFIPLAVRANETKHKQPVVSDKIAVDIFAQFNTDNVVIDGGGISTHGILARTIVIDAEVKRILAQRPNAIVINLGAGLDTRFFRLDNGIIHWYDLDLPEVISLRKQLISENERLHFIAKSVLDKTWTDDIKRFENDTIVIIAEGLLMYFPPEDVKTILETLASSFPNANILFDVVHCFFVKKKISSNFLWGVKKAKEIEDLNKNILLLQVWSTGDILKQRQSLPLRIMNVLPSTKNRSQIIHLKLKG